MNSHRQIPAGFGALRRFLLRALPGVAVAVLAIGSTGCYARAVTRGAVVVEEPTVTVETTPVEVDVVPVEVETYPSYVYRGSNVYLVDGRWYARARGRWVVYRVEPRALASVRVSYEAKFGRHYRPRPEMASPKPHPHVRHHRR